MRIDERFIRDFCVRHDVRIKDEKTGANNVKTLILDHCVFDENHNGTSCAITISPKGVPKYKCEHNSCKGKNLRDFIKKFEPNFDFSDQKNAGGKKAPGELPKIQCVADVERKDIKYLLEPYIVANNITALVGDGGVGKTFVWIDIASAITRGNLPAVMGVPGKFQNQVVTYDYDDVIEKDYPNPDANENRRVLYFTSEDGTDTTLKDRFEWAGADQRNLFFIPLDDENFHNILLDSQELESIIAEVKPALCVLDPLQSFVSGKMGERNNMRRQMDCLTRLASVYNVSFLIVVHTNKQATSDARTKLSDSSDIWDKCRSVLFVGKAGQSRYLSQEKGNYTNKQNDIGTKIFKIDDGRIVHQADTEKKYFDFFTESNFKHDTYARDSAKTFILDVLKENEMPVKDLDASGKSYGIAKTTLDRAKAELKKENKVKYRKESQGKGKGVQWFISLNTVSSEGIE